MHFTPAAVWYCTLKLAAVRPLRREIRPGTIRDTCGQLRTTKLSSLSNPPMRPCLRLIRPYFIDSFHRVSEWILYSPGARRVRRMAYHLVSMSDEASECRPSHNRRRPGD